MDRYVGTDVHAASCTIAIVGPSGRKLGSQVVETNGRAVVEAIRAIPKPRHLCMEEGTQSARLYEVLSPHVQELVVAGVSESRGPKSDARDAFGLAEALRIGAITTLVFKAPGRFARLRELGRTYSMLARDVVRTQNRLKSLYRSRGVATPGKSVYSASGREEFLTKLPVPARTAAIRTAGRTRAAPARRPTGRPPRQGAERPRVGCARRVHGMHPETAT